MFLSQNGEITYVDYESLIEQIPSGQSGNFYTISRQI